MTAGPTIGVLYTCHECGVKEREVVVRERGPQEDVCDWVRHARIAVGVDHSIVSRSCNSNECDLKIPMINKDARIGAAVRQ